MPFSKAYRNAVYPDYVEEGAYVDYKRTKDILHRLKEDITNPATPDELYNSLLEQKEQVYDWCTRKREELLSVARTLAKASESLLFEEAPSNMSLVFSSLNTSKASLLPSKEAKLIADAVLHELLRFVECRNLNTDTIEHIIGRMYRYSVLGPTGDKWRNIGTQHDFTQISIDEVFYLVSVVYERVKQTEESRGGKKARIPTGNVGSQVFDRRSVKYWVHSQDLPFVIARIIQHLPLSTFKDTYKESKEKKLQFRLGSPVSSVYYDNRSFLFYHRRLERLEGSSLIRMRWYSDPFAEDWNAIRPDDNVFMEIKVHHEAWSGDRSTKRRFAVKEKDVDKYVHARLSLQPAIDKLRKKNSSEKDVEDFKSLASEILTKVHAYELKPVLRTQCLRAAFQRGNDQTIRVSIDTDLRMSAEDFGLGLHWRYNGTDSPVSHFPYAVVEVKLQCAENERIAPWIEELMGCRYMEGIPKYSKYAHGIASLYGHTPHINMVPYWLHQMDVDIRASTKPEISQWDPTIGLASGCFERTADRLIFGTGHAQTQTVGASEAKFLPRTDYAKIYKQVLLGIQQQEEDSGQQQQEQVTSPVSSYKPSGSDETDEDFEHSRVKAVSRRAVSGAAASVGLVPASPGNAGRYRNGIGSLLSTAPPVFPMVQNDVDRRHKAYTTYHLYPYTEGGVETLCFSTSGGRNAAAHVLSGGLIPWQTGKRIKVPQKYDPKTLLTSERYMVKWAEYATTLGLIGIAIINFGESLTLPNSIANLPSFWRANFHIIAGTCFVAVAVMTLVYALFTFQARARRVYARRKIRYDDERGPTFLTIFFICGTLAMAVNFVMARYGAMLTQSDAF